MARFIGTVRSHHPPEELWHYLADLRSVAEWDPSVESIELTGGEPRTESARYRLDVNLRRKTIPVIYRTAELDPPHRVVFRADTNSLSIRDEARIEPAGGAGSIVTWDADVRLRGFRRVLDPLLRRVFNRIGKAAESGLAERLHDPVPETQKARVAP
jgi:carbon monoxide dehydrogenase subunit G